MQAFLMFIAGLLIGLGVAIQVLHSDLRDGCTNWSADTKLCLVDRP